VSPHAAQAADEDAEADGMERLGARLALFFDFLIFPLAVLLPNLAAAALPSFPFYFLTLFFYFQ
jgi:hypothetical protein